jgi:hypothetical protein
VSFRDTTRLHYHVKAKHIEEELVYEETVDEENLDWKMKRNWVK